MKSTSEAYSEKDKMTEQQNRESLEVEIVPQRYKCPICEAKYPSLEEAQRCLAQGRSKPIIPIGSAIKNSESDFFVILKHIGIHNNKHINIYGVRFFNTKSTLPHEGRDKDGLYSWQNMVSDDATTEDRAFSSRLLSESEIEKLCQANANFADLQSMHYLRK